MSHRISISALTHVDSTVPCHDTSESSGLVDARPYLLSLVAALEKQGLIDVPIHVVGWLSDAAAYFQELDSPATLDHPLQTPSNSTHIPHACLLTSPPSRVISRSSSRVLRRGRCQCLSLVLLLRCFLHRILVESFPHHSSHRCSRQSRKTLY